MQRPLVICLTPVKNEAWILDRFLKCASLWADHIIIADQQSTDRSREIARNFQKVTLVENTSVAFNEPERQKVLLAEARRIPGPKVLMALDADEFLTANFSTSVEWETMLRAPKGTVISFQWPLVHSGASDLSYYLFPKELPIGFVDDGSNHEGKAIHSFRVPVPPGAPTLLPKQIKLMHYCLMDRDRFDSRVRWYQCWEHLNLKRRPLELYRFYHQDLFVPSELIKPVPPEWFQAYEQRGIDMTSVNRQGTYHWDAEVIAFFKAHGTTKFKRLAIWDKDWASFHHELFPGEPQMKFPDPRSWFDKTAHRWLRRTQPAYCFGVEKRRWFFQRHFHHAVHRLLGLMGW